MDRQGWWVLAAIVLLVLTVAITLTLPGPAPVMKLDLTGTPGVKVEGTCEVDGKVHEVSGVLPLSQSFQGRDLSFSVQTAEPGKLQVSMELNGESMASAGMTGSGSGEGVSGGMHAGRFRSRGAWITTYGKK